MSYLCSHAHTSVGGSSTCGCDFLIDIKLDKRKLETKDNYCSSECMYNRFKKDYVKVGKHIRENFICKYCGKEFKSYGKNPIYCSSICYRKFRFKKYQ